MIFACFLNFMLYNLFHSNFQCIHHDNYSCKMLFHHNMFHGDRNFHGNRLYLKLKQSPDVMVNNLSIVNLLRIIFLLIMEKFVSIYDRNKLSKRNQKKKIKPNLTHESVEPSKGIFFQ